MLKIGHIDYLNTLPIYAGLDRSRYEWYSGPPYKVNKDFLEGKVDVSLVSSAVYLRNRKQFSLLPFCVSSQGPVMSVCLFSKFPVQDLGGKTVALPMESAASRALLEVLCSDFWKVEPRWVDYTQDKIPTQADAFLMIGDPCLNNRRIQGYRIIDLGEEWHRFTQLPFVFACLVCHQSVKRSREVAELTSEITRFLTDFEKDSSEFVRQISEKTGRELEEMAAYFSLLHYRIFDEHRDALEEFSLRLKSYENASV